MTFSPSASFGNSYLPTYRNYQLEGDALSQALTRDYITIAYAVNTKINGVFETTETQNGKQYYSITSDQSKKRYVFQKSFIIPAISAGSSFTVAHGITNVQQFTDYYGVCITDVPDNRSLPYPSVTANANIEFNIDSVNINIKPGAASPNIVSGSVTLEYLKQ